MNTYATFFVVMGSLFIIPGCGRISDWVHETFEQETDSIYVNNYPSSYLRNIVVYDDGVPPAKFSALPLLDEVLDSYACMYAYRMGMSGDEKISFLEQWKYDNGPGLSFYVLSLYEYPLGKSDSEWGIFAEIGCIRYRPSSIKTVELPLEFKVFFGKEYTIFREAYLVSFNVDSSTLDTVAVKLFFRSITKQALLCWDNFNNDEDCYRC